MLATALDNGSVSASAAQAKGLVSMTMVSKDGDGSGQINQHLGTPRVTLQSRGAWASIHPPIALTVGIMIVVFGAIHGVHYDYADYADRLQESCWPLRPGGHEPNMVNVMSEDEMTSTIEGLSYER